MMNEPLIFKKFPGLKEKLPWISLGQFPTPVQPLQKIGKEIGLDHLWIKRDDLSGELYGGNKVRTLEFSLADAKQKRSDLVIAYSSLGSNWPLACVIYARLLDLPTDVYFAPFPMDSVKQKNLSITERLANRVCSAKSLFTFPGLLYFQFYKSRKKSRVYFMPAGGTSPVATLGWVNAVLELQQQVENGEMPRPDYIICPLGSGGTTAGLSIGLNLIDWQTQVLSVRVVNFIVANKLILNRLIRKTVKILREKCPDNDYAKNWGKNVQIIHTCFGPGYSQPTAGGEKCIALFRTLENQTLDSTYSGKAFAAVLELSQQSKFKNKNLLFWQTLNSRNLDNLVNHFV